MRDWAMSAASFFILEGNYNEILRCAQGTQTRNLFNLEWMWSPITASMVNSYVKKGLMPKPIKKKYSQEHVASLILITIMKQVYSLDDIHEWLLTNVQDNYQENYNSFCKAFNTAFADLDLHHFNLDLHFDESSRVELTFNLIIQTVICKIISEHLINEH